MDVGESIASAVTVIALFILATWFVITQTGILSSLSEATMDTHQQSSDQIKTDIAIEDIDVDENAKTITLTIRNTGQSTIEDYSDMDVFVNYYSMNST
jgi:archaellum component FlaG (FlaF/FlaG flagellin family)